jgi:adenosine deaminase
MVGVEFDTLSPMNDLASQLPWAELHVHLEGTLEAPMVMDFARRNHVSLPWTSPDELTRAYRFTDLQDFLDLYYAACAVLVTERDFHDLTAAYLARAKLGGVRHVEMFFDPETHMQRGVDIGTVITGIASACAGSEQRYGITTQLIMCFLRDRTGAEALTTLRSAKPFIPHLSGVGLDSAERGNPPSRFVDVFRMAREDFGLHAVAHAGEEGPSEYIWQALNLLGAERIDHGVRCVEDPQLVAHLVRHQIPLTVCPLSNVRLGVFPDISAHVLDGLLKLGLQVSVHSDDPAYFGGYLLDNLRAVQQGLGLTNAQIVQLARNSFTAAFIPAERKIQHCNEIEVVAERMLGTGWRQHAGSTTDSNPGW